MNIFILSWCVDECARFHFDKHVVKMILELAQILSTVHHIIFDGNDVPEEAYKPTNKKHPCCLWATEHVNNYRFVADLGLALCKEYTFRYEGRTHKTEAILKSLKEKEPPPHLFTNAEESILVGPYKVTEPAQAMPERFKVKKDVISAYMQYYHADSKAYMRSWKKREIPDWFDTTVVLKTPSEGLTSSVKKRQISKFYESSTLTKKTNGF